MPVFRRQEVSLFGTTFPILGDVRVSLPSQFANKMVVGDYTKDSEKYVSSLAFSDQRGGIGIKDMVEARDADRCDWSTCEIGFKGHIVLPPQVTDCDNPTTTYNAPLVMIEFGNAQYVCFTTKVYSWTEATSTWSALLKTLSGTPSSACVHKSKLYIAVGTDFERFSGAAWTTGLALSGSAVPAKFIFEWDSKLVVVAANGNLSYSTDEGVTLTANAAPAFETGVVNSCFLAPDDTGAMTPYLGTTHGTYVLDFTNSKWQETGLMFPEHDYGCLGPATWRDGASYVPVGLGIFQYQPSASPIVITPVGLDQGDGIPNEYRGHIIGVVNEYNNLYALLNAAATTARDLYTTEPFGGTTTFYDDEGYSAITKWNGKGWAVPWKSGATDAAITCGVVNSADDEYRLWFGADNKAWYIPLSRDLQNPIQLTTSTYQASGIHYYPVFDADNAVVDKMALAVTVSVEYMSATEIISIEYQVDGAGDWTKLTNTTYATGDITADGEVVFTFASGAGVNFKRIQFRANLARGSTTTLSPDLRWFRLDYMKLTVARWQYSFVVDCTKDYKHQRASTLEAALKAIPDNMTLGSLIYRTFQGTTTTVKVRLLSSKGIEPSGQFKVGQYQVVALEP